jgi:hypothetical protein
MFSSTGSVTKTDGRLEAEGAPTNIMDKKEDSLNKNYSTEGWQQQTWAFPFPVVCQQALQLASCKDGKIG